MNGRKLVLPELGGKELAERCARTAETPRPRWAALPSGREERHCDPWQLEVCLAIAEGVEMAERKFPLRFEKIEPN